MSKTHLKPRWDAWQFTCLRKAIEAQIPLKIISVAIERTPLALSKKMKDLGLREKGNFPGRMKGKQAVNINKRKAKDDISKMTEILHTSAPSRYYQKGQESLANNAWSFVEPPFSQKGASPYLVSALQEKISFSLPLKYILTKDHLPPRRNNKAVFGDPFYVSFHSIEKWASSQGFQRMRGGLQRKGLSYWKDGKLFSKAQLLMYVNRLRHDRKLQPLALYEDEKISVET